MPRRSKRGKKNKNSKNKKPSEDKKLLDEEEQIEESISDDEQYYCIPFLRRLALDDQPLTAEETYSVRHEYTNKQMRYNKIINKETLIAVSDPVSVISNTDDFKELYSLISKKFSTRGNSILVQYNPLASKTMEGPTCGIVALSMASQVIDEIEPPDLLVTAIEQRFTRVGEMFDVSKMARFAELNLNCEAKVISNLEKLKFELLEHICDGWPVLIPYDRNDGVANPIMAGGSCAHWAVLNGLAFRVELTDGSKRGDIFISTTVRPSIKEKLLDYFDREFLKGKPKRETRAERRVRREREKKWDAYVAGLESMKKELCASQKDKSSASLKGKSAQSLKGKSAVSLKGKSAASLKGKSAVSLKGKSAASLKDKSAASLKDKSAESTRGIYVLARESSSERIYAWEINELLKSNGNLKLCEKNNYVPFDIDLEHLCDKAILFKKRV